MARARNIKPGFFKNEDLVECDFATRLLFIGLWTIADREGRLEDRPKKIKMDVFPADEVAITEMISKLEQYSFVSRYEINGARYIQIANWSKHQNPHHTEKASEIPGIDGEITVKEPIKPKYSPKQDGGNLADSLIPDSLIPDSLIPDSLIPDSLIPDSLIPDSLIPDSLIPDSVEQSRKRSDTPSGVSDSVWQDFKKLRRAKKAAITDTALAGIQREANKAGVTFEQALKTCCERGWTGFNADWVKADQAKATGETAYQRSMRERFEEASGRKTSNIIDITPSRMEALS